MTYSIDDPESLIRRIKSLESQNAAQSRDIDAMLAIISDMGKQINALGLQDQIVKNIFRDPLENAEV